MGPGLEPFDDRDGFSADVRVANPFEMRASGRPRRSVPAAPAEIDTVRMELEALLRMDPCLHVDAAVLREAEPVAVGPAATEEVVLHLCDRVIPRDRWRTSLP